MTESYQDLIVWKKAMEVETELVIAEGLRFVGTADLQHARSLADEISRMLSALQRRLREKGRGS